MCVYRRNAARKSSICGSCGAAGPAHLTDLPCACLFRHKAGGTSDPIPVTQTDPLRLGKRSTEWTVLIWFCCPGKHDHSLHTHTRAKLLKPHCTGKNGAANKQFPLRVPCRQWPFDHFPSPRVPSAASMGCSFHGGDQLLEMDSPFPALGMHSGRQDWNERLCNSEEPHKRYSSPPCPLRRVRGLWEERKP